MATIRMPPLHPKQAEIVHDPTRFVVAPCGRRFGKTRGAVVKLLAEAFTAPRSISFWVAPIYKQTRVPWRLMTRLVRRIPGTTILKAERIIRLPNEAEIAFHTGDDPHSLQSEGLHYCVLDECHDMPQDVWTEAVRPSLMDTGGRALLIGRGGAKTWYYDAFQRGLSDDPEWRSYHFTSYDNPHLDPAEIDAYLADPDIPETVKQQHVFAEFVDESGDVFRFVRDAAKLRPEDARNSGCYVFVDIADSYDFNAVAVVARDGERICQLYADRWNRVPVEDTIARVQAVADRFRGACAFDATSMGGGFAAQWLNRGQRRWQPVKFNGENKRGMVNHLQALLETHRIDLLRPVPGEPSQFQYDELLNYQATKLPSGAYRYEAPSGKHDDMVTALMGACWLAKEDIGIRARDSRLVRDLVM